MQIKGRSKSAEKRELILDAAVTLFMEQGYPNTSMDQVATRAGVSKQTVYSHFKDKKGLFGAAVEDRCKRAAMREIDFDPAISLRDNLLDLAQGFCELITSEDAIRTQSNCITHRDSDPDLGVLFYESGPLAVITAAQRAFAKLNDDNLLDIPNPDNAAVQFLAMIQGNWHLRCMLGVLPIGSKPDEKYLTECVDIFLRAHSKT